MKKLTIINSHYDFEYIDLEIKSGKDHINISLYNSENLHPSWLIENQSASIVKQIELFIKEQKHKIRRDVDILIDIIKDGQRSYMPGLLRFIP